MKRLPSETLKQYRFRRSAEQLKIKLIEGGKFAGTNVYALHRWYNQKYNELVRKTKGGA